mgnify:FL=1|jgi:hypothetical protein|tara:strand:+ start:2177 stop:2548 length:372 start_codon:yes stop_codon:yes gene_type:complete
MNLTVDQLTAVKAYAEQHGEEWKTSLQSDWMRSGSATYRGEWAHLQQLRNRLGPKWLYEFQLAELLDRASQPRNTWTTSELQEDFEVEGFGGGLCVVRRKSDNQRGSLQFDHMPRLYFNFVPA